MFAGLMPFQAWVDLRGVKGSDMAGEGGVLDFAEPVSISTQVHRHLRQAIIQGEFCARAIALRGGNRPPLRGEPAACSGGVHQAG